MRSQSITFRLTALFAALSTTVLLAVGSMVGYLVEEHFEMMDMAELSGKMELMRHALAKVQSPADLTELPQRLDDALVGHAGLVVAVLAADGRALYATLGADFPNDLVKAGTGHFTSRSMKPLTWKQGEHSFRGIAVAEATAILDAPPLTVAMALDIGHHAEFMAAFYKMLWVSVALGIVLTSFLGWFVAWRGLLPMRLIAVVAKGISAERLHDRLPLEKVPIELIDLTRSFNDMLARLEDSFKRLSDFSSDIAHELRTPVSNLMTQTQVALTKSRTEDEYREILYSNLEEYDRLARMISDMLFIAKAENGLIVLQHQAVDLGAEIDQLIGFYQAVAEDQGVTVMRLGNGIISGEQLMIRRAIGNLFSNAIRHTPKGGTVTISVAEADPDGIRITVENTGEDISPEHLPRLFDRFYRVDPSRKHISEGAGLGLAIVKSIADAHGGKVSVSSSNGLTSFAMSIPSA